MIHLSDSEVASDEGEPTMFYDQGSMPDTLEAIRDSGSASQSLTMDEEDDNVAALFASPSEPQAITFFDDTVVIDETPKKPSKKPDDFHEKPSTDFPEKPSKKSDDSHEKPSEKSDDFHEKPSKKSDDSHEKPSEKSDDPLEKPSKKADDSHEKPSKKSENSHEKPVKTKSPRQKPSKQHDFSDNFARMQELNNKLAVLKRAQQHHGHLWHFFLYDICHIIDMQVL